MTIATPLSLRWERAQHIDRSAIEPLGFANPVREHLGPTFWVTLHWDTLAPHIAENMCHSVVRDGPAS